MKKIFLILSVTLMYVTLTSQSSCNEVQQSPQSASGVSKASTIVKTDLNGKTIEQNHVIDRLEADNKAGSIKHLYIISAISGQVLIYSTVKGKVTSSGKRLTPSTVDGSSGISPTGETTDKNSCWYNNRITIGDNNYITNEVLGDDGTYGSSSEYIYWWDSKGIYHQEYPCASTILHISDQPLSVKSVVINMEQTTNP